jgi:soluble lytic murein transglycosylase
VLDDFGRLAGHGRGRLQRRPRPPAPLARGPHGLEAGAWAENIPFNETRDYVKKVLANATVYGHVSAPAEARDLP